MTESVSIRDRLRRFSTSRTVKTHISSLGVDVFLRLVSFRVLKEILSELRDIESREDDETAVVETLANIVQKVSCEEDGSSIWGDSPEDLEEIRELPVPVIKEIVTSFMEVNGGTPEDAVKN